MDKMVMNVDMLCLLMEHRIPGEGKAHLVITIKEWRIIEVGINMEVTE
jgi:hypothetical protein